LHWLEPDEGKLSRPVLRGAGGGNVARLSDPFADLNFMKLSSVWLRPATTSSLHPWSDNAASGFVVYLELFAQASPCQ
jgi:hypothetical protein